VDSDLRPAAPALGRQLSKEELAAAAEKAKRSEQQTIDVSSND
jgi:hypothetical protein